MFDVDYFKHFNDEHGHDMGDRVLQYIADTVRRVIRKIDVPCRYGGEEFLIILPETSFESAMAVAERVRAAGSELEQLASRLEVLVSKYRV